jgi:hypothetical protein
LTNKEKNQFRKTQEWIQFRENQIKTRGLKCELFGTRLSKRTAQLHHLDPADYTNLDPVKFKLLSPTAHALVEFLALLIHGNTTKVPRLDLLMAWIGPVLPAPERTVQKYYDMIQESVARNKEVL